MSKNLTRVLVALLLLATLTAGAAQAAPWSFSGPEPARVAAFWDWIVALFEGTTGDEGCSMDPNGGCLNGGTSDEGSGMDPNGLTCRDEGCSMDPNG